MGEAMGSPTANFTHHFLIAMPAMADPHFSRTLTYVCEHNEDGALGIVVNRPTAMTLSALFEQIDVPLVDALLRRTPVHFGGPVQVDRGFVLHRPLGNWQSTLAIDDEVGLTTSKDVLEAVARGEGPRDVIVSLGYAGWSAGQLEEEIAQNAWLTVAADPDVLFETPAAARLPAAMRLLGITPRDRVANLFIAGHLWPSFLGGHDIARAIGEPDGARAVGQALGRNPWAIIVPCHRVVGANDKLVGFSANGGIRTKLKMLKIEGWRENEPSLFEELV
jgi:putative transcriptional regulator